MTDLISKFKTIIKELEKEHGSILFFGLFLRIEPFEIWDVVISASWLTPDLRDSYKIVADKIQKTFSKEELLQLSGIVILAETDPTVAFFLNLKTVTNGHFEEANREELSDKFGFTIKKAYILRCDKSKATPKEKS